SSAVKLAYLKGKNYVAFVEKEKTCTKKDRGRRKEACYQIRNRFSNKEEERISRPCRKAQVEQASSKQ
ncbi:unnamed protein product, partial [Ceratitis capitata]